jgi:hypothetical protein
MVEATEATRGALTSHLEGLGYVRVAECRNNLYANIFFDPKRQ